MRLPNWLRPPRHLLALFGVVTLVPAVALVWLGWQLIDQDRSLERQQIQERLDATADRVVSAIARDLDAIDVDLPRWPTHLAASLHPGAAVVTLGPSGVIKQTGTPLMFVPGTGREAVLPPRPQRDQADLLEFRTQDARAAARAYREMAASAEVDARAYALVGLARNLRNLGRHDEALAAYASLETMTTARVIDEPAELLARAAMCQMLAQLNRIDELKLAAASLARDLAGGRWSIDRGTYEMRINQLRQWTPVPSMDEAVALARAVDAFWNQHQSATPAMPASGRRAVTVDGREVLLVWQRTGDDLTAFVASAKHLERNWQPAWTAERAKVALLNADGRVVIGEPPSSDVRTATRSNADTGLPWTIRVSSAATATDIAGVVQRRRLMTWGLAMLVLLIPAGGYVVARAVQKELAVARLQADFVSAVSHEFRTPLTSMAHLTERLQRDPDIPDGRKHQYYDAIARDTERLRRFVDTLLDFGRMEAGANQLRLEPIDLTAVVTDVVREFRTDAAAGEHEVSISLNDPVPPVRLDREAFGRALWNLLDNAGKYSPPAAPITVEVGRDAGRAVVHVRDQGNGIPAAERRQIFQNFVRGAESRTSGIRGTGVGLAMVDRIITAHGGEVRLESEVGAGSTFSLLLPLAEQAPV